jgi:predicted outer membrane repeat protein
VWITLEFGFIEVSGPSSSARSGGAISGTGCIVP